MSTRRRAILAAIAVATALAGVLRYSGAPALLAFAVATLSLAGLAWVVSVATEQVGERFGPAATGVLQSTLGNLPELFVVIFALQAGQITVAKFSVLGSILANALLVLGLAIIAGARASEDGIMRFSPKLPNDTATLLLLASFIITLVGVALATQDVSRSEARDISVVSAVCVLAVYLAWVVPYIRSGGGGGNKTGPLALPLTLLGVGGLASAFVSDWFIHALEPTITQLRLSEAFAGLVIVAIAGNAVENATGIVLAHRGQADLAISVIKNSVAQVAAFLWPVLVLASLLLSHRLDFALDPVYIAALFATAIAIYQVTFDGEASLFEGAALVASFVVLGTLTLYE